MPRSKRFVVVDVETTGLSPAKDKIVELAILDVTKWMTQPETPQEDKFEVKSWLINPDQEISASAYEIHGISNADVRACPKFADLAQEVWKVLGNAVVIAHEAAFDIGFLAAEFRATDRVYQPFQICTLAAARQMYPMLESHKLGALNTEFGLNSLKAHRASSDVKTAAALFLKMHRENPMLAAVKAPKIKASPGKASTTKLKSESYFETMAGLEKLFKGLG